MSAQAGLPKSLRYAAAYLSVIGVLGLVAVLLLTFDVGVEPQDRPGAGELVAAGIGAVAALIAAWLLRRERLWALAVVGLHIACDPAVWAIQGHIGVFGLVLDVALVLVLALKSSRNAYTLWRGAAGASGSASPVSW